MLAEADVVIEPPGSRRWQHQVLGAGGPQRLELGDRVLAVPRMVAEVAARRILREMESRRASISTSSRSPRLTTSTADPGGTVLAHGGVNPLDQPPVPETPRGAEVTADRRLRRRPLQPLLQVAYVLLEPVGLPLEDIVVEVAVKPDHGGRPGEPAAVGAAAMAVKRTTSASSSATWRA